jgi:hypothetical protein
MTAALAADANYDRLIDQEKFGRLDKSTIIRMQRNLAQIYQGDHEWNRDVALSQHPLTDGVMGPVTLYWLQRFIHNFKIEPVGQYVNETRKRLERIASFSGMFPEETKVLISADFANWNDDRPEAEKNSYYTVRRKGTDQALLDLVYLYLQVAYAPPGSITGKDQPVIDYYELTAEDFKNLQGKSQLYAQLSKLVNKKFDNVAALKEAIAGALKDHPELVEKLMPVIEQYYRYANPVISQSFLEILAGDPFFSSLNSVLVTLLEKTLQGVAYPDKNLFDQAAKSKIYAGIGACQDMNKQNAYLSGLKISDDDFKKLSDDLLTGPYEGMRDLSEQLKEIDLLRQHRREACEPQDLALIDEFAAGLYEHVVQPAIALLYQKNPVYRAASAVQWDGSGCGCVIDDLSGTVYGFYPFWLAGEKQTVNFSVLSRIAYYGLSFDDDGVIKQANNVHNESTVLSKDSADWSVQTAFIQAARKHNSKVDWVIRNDKSYWNRWKKLPYSSRATVFETLTEHIVSFLTSAAIDSMAKIKQNMTLGIVTPPTLGDGVTLYFDGFPDDRESVELFNQFFTGLQKRLIAEKNDYYVNIVVPQSALGTGIYRYSNLVRWIDNRKSSNDASAADMRTNILVLIEEPTTDSKKKLRSDIESGELHGIERSMLRWHIIPVIEFGGRNWQQLEDDIVYFKDNFGGIGFWPMPANEPEAAGEVPLRCDTIQSVSGCLVRFFQNTDWYGYGEPDSFLERFVCENRDYFRIALELLTALCLVFAGLYFYSCRVHNAIKNFYLTCLLLVVPTLIVAFLLLAYDPLLESLSKGNLPLFLVIFGGITLAIVIYLRRKKQMRKPSRPRVAFTASDELES